MEGPSWLKATTNSLDDQYEEPEFDTTAYYTTIVIGSVQKGSNIMKLSSTRGVYIGREVYLDCVKQDDVYMTIIDVNYETDQIALSEPVSQTVSGAVVKIREPYVEFESEEEGA
jgi:hypothetical protein